MQIYAHSITDRGELCVSEDGHPYWQRGDTWFVVVQFRNTVLLATNQPTNLVEMVCISLSHNGTMEVWNYGTSRFCVTTAASSLSKHGPVQTRRPLFPHVFTFFGTIVFAVPIQ